MCAPLWVENLVIQATEGEKVGERKTFPGICIFAFFSFFLFFILHLLLFGGKDEFSGVEDDSKHVRMLRVKYGKKKSVQITVKFYRHLNLEMSGFLSIALIAKS